MKCPYRGFKEDCDWDNCPARMLVDNKSKTNCLMKVCALAYNGAPIPNNNSESEKEKEQKNEN